MTGRRVLLAALLALVAVTPVLVTDDVLLLLATGMALAVGAIGLNLLTGYAGQISLGHAFFVGLGAYTAAALSGPRAAAVLGVGAPIGIWLPASAALPALVGALVAPLASRLRGLYLAIVTLGLVFVGEHVFRTAAGVTGGPGVGRPGVNASVLGVSLTADGALFTRPQKVYWLALAVLLTAALAGRNLADSAVGRAFAAVRDHEVAAEVLGVRSTATKVRAFTVSSAYAGVCGAVLYTIIRQIDPSSFGLVLSIQFVAMIVVGGVATIAGAVAGALFLTVLPRLTRALAAVVPFLSAGATGGLLTAAQLEAILYGLLVIAFLIAEPRGLVGLWVRVRARLSGRRVRARRRA